MRFGQETALSYLPSFTCEEYPELPEPIHGEAAPDERSLPCAFYCQIIFCLPPGLCLALARSSWARTELHRPQQCCDWFRKHGHVNPSVPRPNTTPCVVQLFSNLNFADFHPKGFTYTPPADCPPPWAAVVLNADWSIDSGRQFDRTAEI